MSAFPFPAVAEIAGFVAIGAVALAAILGIALVIDGVRQVGAVEQ